MPLADSTLNPASYQIELIKGSTRTLLLAITDDCALPVDLTGARIVMTVKAEFDDEFPVIYKDSLNVADIVITDLRGGEVEIYLLPSDTLSLSSEFDYMYDVWVILFSGEQVPVIPPSVFKVRSSVSVLS